MPPPARSAPTPLSAEERPGQPTEPPAPADAHHTSQSTLDPERDRRRQVPFRDIREAMSGS